MRSKTAYRAIVTSPEQTLARPAARRVCVQIEDGSLGQTSPISSAPPIAAQLDRGRPDQRGTTPTIGVAATASMLRTGNTNFGVAFPRGRLPG